MKICLSALLLLVAVSYVAAQEPGTEAPVITSAKHVLQQIAAGQFDSVEAQYDEQMSASLAPGKLASAWSTLLESGGSFNSVAAATVTKVQTYDVVILVCMFQKGPIDAQIVFDSEGKLAGLYFRPHKQPEPAWVAPAYAKPESFTEQPLTLTNGKFEMPGTLTMPKGNGPFPAIVLVHGSGPHDQDETIGPNKPFEDLAWGIASQGVAVFRYTKRTQKYGAQSSDDPAKLTVNEETISDARAAVALVAKQSKIDPKKIFLVGHSLGAYLAPRIATGDADLAGIAMLAGNTRPMEVLMVDEVHYILANGPPPTADERKQAATIEESAKKIESADLKAGDSVAVFGGTMPASYWLDLRDYHPVETAETLKIPIFILQGGRDFQVPPATNFEEWKKALNGRRNVTLKPYPDLNHLFIAGTGLSLPAEYEKVGHVDQQVVTDIAAWVNAGGRSEAVPALSH
jgi:uncharacterized protein